MCWKSIARALTAACAMSAQPDATLAAELPTSAAGVGLIPKPVQMAPATGSFPLSPECAVLYQAGSAGPKATAEYLATTLHKGLGFPLAVRQAGAQIDGAILLTSAGGDDSLGREGYRL